MALIPALVALALVIGYVLGGRLRGFEDLRINR